MIKMIYVRSLLSEFQVLKYGIKLFLNIFTAKINKENIVS